jgi:hypothetical protein
MEYSREDITHVVVKPENVLRTFATEKIDAGAGEPNRTRLLVNQHVNWAVGCEDIRAKSGSDEHAEEHETDARGALLHEGAKCATERRLRI